MASDFLLETDRQVGRHPHCSILLCGEHGCVLDLLCQPLGTGLCNGCGLSVCVPQIPLLEPYAHCDGGRRWGLGEVTGSRGQSPHAWAHCLVRDSTETPPALCREDTARRWLTTNREEALTARAGTLALDLQLPELSE